MPDALATYAARVRAEIDRVYTGLRHASGPSVRAVVSRHGFERIGLLNDVYFGILARPLSAADLAAVERYAAAEDLTAAVTATIDAGLTAPDGAGRIVLTDPGRTLLLEVQAAIAGPSEPSIPVLNGFLERLLGAGRAGGGPAFAVMAPPYEPVDAAPTVLFAGRLGAFRHHRADAHAAAWAACGLTAAQMLALVSSSMEDDDLRRSIEDETNRRDAPVYAALDATERSQFLDALSTLPG